MESLKKAPQQLSSKPGEETSEKDYLDAVANLQAAQEALKSAEAKLEEVLEQIASRNFNLLIDLGVNAEDIIDKPQYIILGGECFIWVADDEYFGDSRSVSFSVKPAKDERRF